MTQPACIAATRFVIASAIISKSNMEESKGDVTLLLERLAKGDHSAEEALMPRVYAELHRIASARLRAERPGHTLQATALVHEAYLRLCRGKDVDWQNRAHFFRVSAQQIRRILVDYARQHKARKRNDGATALPLDEAIAFSCDQSAVALEVDEVLDKLAEISPRQAQVVEMRFFAGLSEEEIAAALGTSVRTIRRDWLVARAWLHGQMTR